MNDPTQLSIYQLRAVLNGVSPLVWRRFLLSIETSLADLHKILQLSFGWSGFYLYEFCIHGKTFGSNAEDPRSVCLGDFQLRPVERFRYRYNFLVFWESDLRLEVGSGRAQRSGTRAGTGQFYRGMPGGLGGITDSQWPAYDWH